ncbi:MAG: hypothetical protein AAFR52_13505, partial [Pseudomonadota bacterium]
GLQRTARGEGDRATARPRPGLTGRGGAIGAGIVDTLIALDAAIDALASREPADREPTSRESADREPAGSAAPRSPAPKAGGQAEDRTTDPDPKTTTDPTTENESESGRRDD